MPALWHWNFGGAVAEQLVQGREHVYFERFWDYAVDPRRSMTTPAPITLRNMRRRARCAPRSRSSQRSRRTRATMPSSPAPSFVCRCSPSGRTLERARARRASVRWSRHLARRRARRARDHPRGAGHWLIEESPGPTIARIRAFIAR